MFDPGTDTPEVDPWDTEELRMVQDLLQLRYPVLKKKVASMDSGVICDEGVKILMKKVLFNSGAMHSSYISKELVDRNRSSWSSKIKAANGLVRLGDNVTTRPVTEQVTLTTKFTEADTTEHTAQVTFCVFEMPGLDAIIGLPDILDHFLNFFVNKLEAAKSESQGGLFLALSDGDLRERYPDLTEPWTQAQDETPVEELETDIPCSFSGPLYYLSKSYEEVLQDYKDMFESHVAEDWRKDKRVMSILLSDAAIEVFVPREWRGIQGFEPVEFQFREDMPAEHRPPYRPINPKLFEPTKKEFARMCEYMYVDSDSPIAAPLVVAPKATSPFIRICGDYVWLNKYLVVGHYYIPHVMHELEKAAGFKYFIDLDLTNSFHQIILGPNTSAKLSVTTPWGLKRPVYLPEGVAPASGILQRMVMSVFGDFSDWVITLFDNILVLCNDIDDGVNKLQKIIQRCHERRVVLKFAKSWIGFQQVKFFGYKVTPGQYEMDEERKQGVMEAPMPSNTKQMQRFLGVAVFFNEFIPNYSEVTAKLYDMIKPDFKWDSSTWTVDYHKEFDKVKKALVASVAKHFPDYEKDWIIRADASDKAFAAVLLQVMKNDKGEDTYHPIAFKSRKLSGPATRWDIYKEEAYAVYFAVKSFAYYLHGKQFILETDHQNLLWMEKSKAYIVIRWRVYLQSFLMLLRNIKGKDNIVADWGSRMYALENDPVPDREPVDEPARRDPEFYLQQVHGGRMLHHGARKTWQKLNQYFPGHHIPFRVVQEFVHACPRCQKDRLDMTKDIQPVVRTVLPDHHRTRLGIDALAITPPDEDGCCMAIVIVELKTKHVAIYPGKSYDQQTAATALFRYMCTFGLHDEIISDPGSQFLSDTVKQLNAWFGIRHRVSLVDVHESNGVERTNGEILRHLRALVNDERIKKKWSKPYVLPLIEFALNDRKHTESPYSAFELKFGSDDARYFKLPDTVAADTIDNAWLKELNENLRVIREATKEFQERLIEERRRVNPPEEQRNTYQPGDFILYDTQHNPCRMRTEKLGNRYKGPYQVIMQYKDEVEARHICMGFVTRLLVERVKLFVGTREDAYRLSQEDADQFEIEKILAWRGDPEKRTTMEFEVQFADGEVVWKVWDQDLFQTIQYEEFCRNNKELYPLLFDLKTAKIRLAEMNRTPITGVQPGDIVYVNIRFFDTNLYDNQLQLEDKYHIKYVVKMQYTRWSSKAHTVIDAKVPAFLNTYELPTSFVYRWGSCRELSGDMVEVTPLLVYQNPDILQLIPQKRNRERAWKALKQTFSPGGKGREEAMSHHALLHLRESA